MKLIAIIPAKSTSKRLQNKNFKEFFGKPIINWVVDEVVKSGLFDKIIVSTDYDGFLNSSLDNSVVLNKRPKHLLADTSTVDRVCATVLETHQGYDFVCCIYPTAYAISSEILMKSFTVMMNFNYSYCQSTGMLNHKRYGEKYEIDNGGFYWAPTDSTPFDLVKVRRGIEMPQVDINTQEDFDEAIEHAKTLGRFE